MPSIHKEICEVCLKSDVLCPACEEKLRKGVIEDFDLEIARFLESLKEKFKILKEAQIYKAVKTESQIVIIAKKGDASKIIGKNGSIVKILSKEFKLPVKVAEYKEDIKEFLNTIVFPASIEGIDIVYKKSGEKLFKIRIPRNQARKINQKIIKKLTESIFHNPTEIVIV